jgi:hypothetical protein
MSEFGSGDDVIKHKTRTQILAVAAVKMATAICNYFVDIFVFII